MMRNIKPRRHLTFELLYDLYVNQELSSTEIGGKLGIPVGTIQYNLSKRLGIGMRSMGDALRIKAEKDPRYRPHRYQAGDKHWNWRGGRHIHSDGYVYVYAPNHHSFANSSPRGKRVREHIFVWEEANNKQLPRNWVVHHINGIKTDNRPENLVAMPRNSHHNKMVLQTVQERLRSVEDENRKLKAMLNLEPSPSASSSSPAPG